MMSVLAAPFSLGASQIGFSLLGKMGLLKELMSRYPMPPAD